MCDQISASFNPMPVTIGHDALILPAWCPHDARMMPAWCPLEMGLKEYWHEAEIWSHISPHTYVTVLKIWAPYTNCDRQDRPTTLKSIFEFLGLKDTNDAPKMPSWNGIEGVLARGWNLVKHKSTYLCCCDENFSSLYQLARPAWKGGKNVKICWPGLPH